MRRIFNILGMNKKENKLESQLPTPVTPNPIKMTINNDDYVIKDNMNIKVQSIAEDVSVYGWSLETRYKFNDDKWSTWYTYYNHRIYNSRETALDAAIKAGLDVGNREYRITALYRMDAPQYREYKIDKILGTRKPKQVYEIKGWKLKEDIIWYKNTHNIGYDIVHKKGTVYIQLEDGSILRSGVTEYTHRVGRDKLFCELIPKGLVEEIVIKDEKWLHPHLLKELKVKLKIK